MGLVSEFTRLTGAEYDRVIADPACVDEILEAERPDGFELSVQLDKALWDLDELLNRARVMVQLEFEGHPLEPGEGVANAWSADDVRRAAQQLREVAFEHLAQYLDETPDEVDYLRYHYENLVRFLVATAAIGSPAVLGTS